MTLFLNSNVYSKSKTTVDDIGQLVTYYSYYTLPTAIPLYMHAYEILLHLFLSSARVLLLYDFKAAISLWNILILSLLFVNSTENLHTISLSIIISKLDRYYLYFFRICSTRISICVHSYYILATRLKLSSIHAYIIILSCVISYFSLATHVRNQVTVRFHLQTTLQVYIPIYLLSKF